MASPGNRHCASCIGTLSFPIQVYPLNDSSREIVVVNAASECFCPTTVRPNNTCSVRVARSEMTLCQSRYCCASASFYRHCSVTD